MSAESQKITTRERWFYNFGYVTGLFEGDRLSTAYIEARDDKDKAAAWLEDAPNLISRLWNLRENVFNSDSEKDKELTQSIDGMIEILRRQSAYLEGRWFCLDTD